MTEFHRENMRKHIAFLRLNANDIRASFSMNRLEHRCGGPSCSLGFATLSVGKRFMEEDYPIFSKRIFGIDPTSVYYSEECIGEYMFGAKWLEIDNTPEAAAARMEAVLYSQVPKDWKFTKEFAHPIVIIPEELETILSKSVNLELVDRH